MQPQCEFSRRFAIADLSDEGAVMDIAADAGERAALSQRFDLLALDALAATVRIERAGGRAVRVGARFVADVVQTCVVTLEPVTGRIEDRFQVLFAPASGPAKSDVIVDPVGDDEPEPLTGDSIDVGEIVAQQLGVALDPYPRRPGAEFIGVEAEAGDDAAADSPFAVLKDVKPGS